MNKITQLIVFTFLVTGTYCFGQTEVLTNFNFEKGGYYLLGRRSESDRNALADSLGEFYTDDIEVLNAIKKAWVFNKPSPKYACGYHYEIIVCKNGEGLESFWVNLNCDLIVSKDGYFFFDIQKLRMFKDRLKKPYRKFDEFSSLNDAREYQKKAITQPTSIFAPNHDWTIYEGTFDFTYVCNDGTKPCPNNRERLLKKIRNEIALSYPGEPFELDERGGSRTKLFIKVKSNKSLADKFSLYKRTLKSADWKPYCLELTTYWTKNPD